MHLDDPADASLCALCGRRWSEVDEGSGWLNVEIARSDGSDGLDHLSEDFCCQEHAAQWLSRPLPPVSPPEELPPLDLQDRLLDAAFCLGLLVCLALALFGAYSLLRVVFG